MKPQDVPVGKRTTPKYRVVRVNDNQIPIVAGSCYVENMGTSRVRLNGNVVIDPGTYHVWEDSDNAIIMDLTVEFLTCPNPPTADGVKYYSGNFLMIETLERHTYKTLVETLLEKIAECCKKYL